MGVGVGTGVGRIVGVGVNAGVGIGVGVAIGDGVLVGNGEGVGLGIRTGVGVGRGVAVITTMVSLPIFPALDGVSYRKVTAAWTDGATGVPSRFKRRASSRCSPFTNPASFTWVLAVRAAATPSRESWIRAPFGSLESLSFTVTSVERTICPCLGCSMRKEGAFA
jgi:hypothetical protein